MQIQHGKSCGNRRITWLDLIVSFGFALFAAQHVAPIWAQANNPEVYQVGGVEMTIPAPSSELVEMGSYRTMMNTYVPDSNRLVAAFLLPDDLKVFSGGTRKGLLRYAMVEVPRSAESTDISAADFQDAVASTDKQFASSADSTAADSLIKQGQDMLNQKLKALNLNTPNVTLDKPVMLGRFFSKTDAYAFGMLVPVSSSGSTVNMLVGVSLLRVKSRVLYCYFYTEYKGDQTEPQMRTELEGWADAILSANAQ